MPGLSARLDLLRGKGREDSGPTVPQSGRDDSLPARLSRTGRRLASKQPIEDVTIAGLLGGEVLADGVVVVRREHALPMCYGKARIVPIDAAALSFAPPDCSGSPLLIDTETTGLAGGSGTLAFLVGLAGIGAGKLTCEQFLLTRFGGEHAMLMRLRERLRAHDCILSFNGKSFDAPLLAARFRLNRIESAIEAAGHLDLLHVTRCAFGGIWEDCRLETAERELLGERRTNDLAGARIPQAWMRFLREGATDQLQAILDHNRNDLIALAALAPVLSAVHAGTHPHGANLLRIARAHARGRRETRALDQLARARPRLDAAGLLELARLQRRRGNLGDALDIWRALAENGDATALERLAKYCEHVARDWPAAERYATRLCHLQPEIAAHAQRRERIARLRQRSALQPELWPETR
jgi:hypothetical protein